ncbi:MAG: histone-lysine N-methyltransferase [Deltaproteobacteria bacterium]|jgi:isopropylmalate/homocitrate/citramalate synthase|nr:histone-lysine N-methyltransferase [Deltaproteobacteria bacterium]
MMEAREGLFRAAPEARRYQLGDPCGNPRLYRDIFPYTEVPRIAFDGVFASPSPAPEPLITDTTFRDGQQARQPYTVEQITTLFRFLARLSGPAGLIRKSEFFLFNARDRAAVDACRNLGLKFPKITGWIRAVPEDLKLVRDMGIGETGILTSISDYHIYLKLGISRRKAMDKYLGLVKEALSFGISPRCHFEDVTRADVYGMAVPFAQQLKLLSEESGIPVLVRLCDTLGMGVTYPGAALPRSVPRLVRAFIEDAGLDGADLEWHGHNDFHKGFANAATAWLYGLGSINATVFGFGERTGNTPLEALLVEHAALKGPTPGVDLTAITEMAAYFESHLGVRIPPNYPLAGRDFNVTSAGIHADGLLKNEEIYNIFDTRKILGRSASITINDKSGAAGLTYWLNERLHLTGGAPVDKRSAPVVKMHRAIQKEYESGRITSMSNRELERLARIYMPQSFLSEFDRLKQRARELAAGLVAEMISNPAVRSMDPALQEPVMERWVQEIPFAQFMYITDSDGIKTTRNVARAGDRKLYLGKQERGMNLSDRIWFSKPMEDGRVHVTGFYTSRFTGALCITVSGPILHPDTGKPVGVLGLDIRFEDLAKMEVDDIDALEIDVDDPRDPRAPGEAAPPAPPSHSPSDPFRRPAPLAPSGGEGRDQEDDGLGSVACPPRR